VARANILLDYVDENVFYFVSIYPVLLVFRVIEYRICKSLTSSLVKYVKDYPNPDPKPAEVRSFDRFTFVLPARCTAGFAENGWSAARSVQC